MTIDLTFSQVTMQVTADVSLDVARAVRIRDLLHGSSIKFNSTCLGRVLVRRKGESTHAPVPRVVSNFLSFF